MFWDYLKQTTLILLVSELETPEASDYKYATLGTPCDILIVPQQIM